MPGASRVLRRVLVLALASALPVLVLVAPATAVQASHAGPGVAATSSAGGVHRVTLAGRRAAVRRGLLAPRGLRLAPRAAPSKLGPGRARVRAQIARARAASAGPLARGPRDAGAESAAAADGPLGAPVDVVVAGNGGPVAWINASDAVQPLPAGMPATTGLQYDNGLVVPGELLTVYADVYNSEDLCGTQTCPNVNHQVEMSWSVQCNGHTEVFSDTETVTAPSDFADAPFLPGALASFQFKVDPALCAQGTPPMFPGGGNQNFFVTAQATVTDVPGDTDPSGSLVPSGFEASMPLSELAGCPVAGNSAGVLSDQDVCADPVDTSTGSFADAFTDATTQAPGFPLVVSRDYSSAVTASGPLGPGWTMPWFASLSADPDTGNVTFDSENGSRYLYSSFGNGTFSAPPGARSILAQTPSGGYTLTTAQQDVLTFTAGGQLTTEEDPTGRGLSFAYAGSQLTSVTDAAGQQVTLAYTGGLLTKITLPDGRVIGYGYAGGRLTSVTTPGGASGEKSIYAYSPGGLLASVQDADGNFRARNTYNASGQVISQENGTGAVTAFSYTTTTGGLPETDVTSPDGGITSDVYGGGVLLETIDALGGTTSYAYNGLLEPITVTDPLGQVTASTYDLTGNMTSQSDPLGNVQQWTFDSRNNLTKYVNPGGHAYGDTYNAMDEPTSRIVPGGTAGETTTYAYDAAGNLSSSVDPRGNTAGAAAASFTTTYTYNTAGQLASVTNPDGDVTATTYDSMGFPLTVTDPLGHVTTNTYNSAEEVVSVMAPGGGITKYAYDLAGNVITRTDPDNRAWTYGYDTDDRLDKITDPLTRTVTYGYDGNGNQNTATDARGITTTTAYDPDNRPVKITYSDSTPAVTYGYDADGRTTSITDATGTRTLTYDADGNLTRAAGPGTKAFTYAYDPDANVTSRVYPDGTSLTYTYTGFDQVQSMTDVSNGSAKTTYAYDADADLTSTAMPDAVTETRGYDNAGQLTSITDMHAATTLDADTLTLDADGQPAKAATTQNSTVQAPWLYTYNAAGQLTAACQTTGAPATCTTAAGGNETTWSFDKAGNMLTKVVPGTSTSYTYDAGEELATSTAGTATTTYGYDLDGDLSTAGTNTYAYNGAGELSAATTSAGTFAYTYDAAGNLSADSKSGALQQTAIWDLNNPFPQLAEQTSAAGATTADLIYNPNFTLAAMSTSAGTYHATTNWLGSVTGLLSSAGAQVSSTTYTPYGTPATTGTPASPIGFAGSYAQPGSGLDDMHARDYNPAAGTFTSVDPLLPDTGQPYAYASDSPAAETDPTGTCPTWLPCGIVSDIVNASKLIGALAKNFYDTACGGPESAGIFAVTGRQTIYQIPDGWVARVADSSKGIVFQEKGAPKTGPLKNMNSIRIMDPTDDYPNGYVRVYNSAGNPVDQYGIPSGPRADTHIPEDEPAPFPELPLP
jgi:RHS repeat-associated protein